MPLGIPRNITTHFIYSSANLAAVLFDLTGINLVLLVNRSTITQMLSWPDLVLGNPSMKSIEICSHFHSGISNGCKNPLGFFFSALTSWQFMHLDINFPTSLFIPSQ